MSHYSAWVNCSASFGYWFLAIWLWITLLVGFIQLKWSVLILFPWWFFIVATIYITLMALNSHKERIFASMAKVYAPFMIIVYWSAVYPNHDPWHSATETYLVLTAHIFLPAFIILESVRPKNTHYARCRQINADFSIHSSFALNTVLYIVYFVVYLIVLPYDHDPIYKNLGFSMNKSEDSIIAFAGWAIVMAINTLLALFTWWAKDSEMILGKQSFMEVSTKEEGPTHIYVMEK